MLIVSGDTTKRTMCSFVLMRINVLIAASATVQLDTIDACCLLQFFVTRVKSFRDFVVAYVFAKQANEIHAGLVCAFCPLLQFTHVPHKLIWINGAIQLLLRVIVFLRLIAHLNKIMLLKKPNEKSRIVK